MYLPIMLDMKGRKAVVAGGGRAAALKIQALLSGGAFVTVISPRKSAELEKWAAAGQIKWLRRAWQEGDARGAFLTFAATDDAELNTEIAGQAGPNQLVHIAGDYEQGDFILPAVLRRGRLTLSVSTGGASPGLARQIRNSLSDQLPEDTETWLEFLFQARRKIREKLHDPESKKKCFQKMMDPAFRQPERQAELLADVDGFIRVCLTDGTF